MNNITHSDIFNLYFTQIKEPVAAQLRAQHYTAIYDPHSPNVRSPAADVVGFSVAILYTFLHAFNKYLFRFK